MSLSLIHGQLPDETDSTNDDSMLTINNSTTPSNPISILNLNLTDNNTFSSLVNITTFTNQSVFPFNGTMLAEGTNMTLLAETLSNITLINQTIVNMTGSTNTTSLNISNSTISTTTSAFVVSSTNTNIDQSNTSLVRNNNSLSVNNSLTLNTTSGTPGLFNSTSPGLNISITNSSDLTGNRTISNSSLIPTSTMPVISNTTTMANTSNTQSNSTISSTVAIQSNLTSNESKSQTPSLNASNSSDTNTTRNTSTTILLSTSTSQGIVNTTLTTSTMSPNASITTTAIRNTTASQMNASLPNLGTNVSNSSNRIENTTTSTVISILSTSSVVSNTTVTTNSTSLQGNASISNITIASTTLLPLNITSASNFTFSTSTTIRNATLNTTDTVSNSSDSIANRTTTLPGVINVTQFSNVSATQGNISFSNASSTVSTTSVSILNITVTSNNSSNNSTTTPGTSLSSPNTTRPLFNITLNLPSSAISVENRTTPTLLSNITSTTLTYNGSLVNNTTLGILNTTDPLVNRTMMTTTVNSSLRNTTTTMNVNTTRVDTNPLSNSSLTLNTTVPMDISTNKNISAPIMINNFTTPSLNINNVTLRFTLTSSNGTSINGSVTFNSTTPSNISVSINTTIPSFLPTVNFTIPSQPTRNMTINDTMIPTLAINVTRPTLNQLENRTFPSLPTGFPPFPSNDISSPITTPRMASNFTASVENRTASSVTLGTISRNITNSSVSGNTTVGSISSLGNTTTEISSVKNSTFMTSLNNTTSSLTSQSLIINTTRSNVSSNFSVTNPSPSILPQTSAFPNSNITANNDSVQLFTTMINTIRTTFASNSNTTSVNLIVQTTSPSTANITSQNVSIFANTIQVNTTNVTPLTQSITTLRQVTDNITLVTTTLSRLNISIQNSSASSNVSVVQATTLLSLTALSNRPELPGTSSVFNQTLPILINDTVTRPTNINGNRSGEPLTPTRVPNFNITQGTVNVNSVPSIPDTTRFFPPNNQTAGLVINTTLASVTFTTNQINRNVSNIINGSESVTPVIQTTRQPIVNFNTSVLNSSLVNTVLSSETPRITAAPNNITQTLFNQTLPTRPNSTELPSLNATKTIGISLMTIQANFTNTPPNIVNQSALPSTIGNSSTVTISRLTNQTVPTILNSTQSSMINITMSETRQPPLTGQSTGISFPGTNQPGANTFPPVQSTRSPDVTGSINGPQTSTSPTATRLTSVVPPLTAETGDDSTVRPSTLSISNRTIPIVINATQSNVQLNATTESGTLPPTRSVISTGQQLSNTSSTILSNQTLPTPLNVSLTSSPNLQMNVSSSSNVTQSIVQPIATTNGGTVTTTRSVVSTGQQLSNGSSMTPSSSILFNQTLPTPVNVSITSFPNLQVNASTSPNVTQPNIQLNATTDSGTVSPTRSMVSTVQQTSKSSVTAPSVTLVSNQTPSAPIIVSSTSSSNLQLNVSTPLNATQSVIQLNATTESGTIISTRSVVSTGQPLSNNSSTTSTSSMLFNRTLPTPTNVSLTSSSNLQVTISASSNVTQSNIQLTATTDSGTVSPTRSMVSTVQQTSNSSVTLSTPINISPTASSNVQLNVSTSPNVTRSNIQPNATTDSGTLASSRSMISTVQQTSNSSVTAPSVTMVSNQTLPTLTNVSSTSSSNLQLNASIVSNTTQSNVQPNPTIDSGTVPPTRPTVPIFQQTSRNPATGPSLSTLFTQTLSTFVNATVTPSPTMLQNVSAPSNITQSNLTSSLTSTSTISSSTQPSTNISTQNLTVLFTSQAVPAVNQTTQPSASLNNVTSYDIDTTRSSTSTTSFLTRLVTTFMPRTSSLPSTMDSTSGDAITNTTTANVSSPQRITTNQVPLPQTDTTSRSTISTSSPAQLLTRETTTTTTTIQFSTMTRAPTTALINETNPPLPESTRMSTTITTTNNPILSNATNILLTTLGINVTALLLNQTIATTVSSVNTTGNRLQATTNMVSDGSTLPAIVKDTTGFMFTSSNTRGNNLLSSLLTASGTLFTESPSTFKPTNSTFPSTTTTMRSNSTISVSNDCVFPFLYLGQWYDKCVSDILNDSWCSLTSNFDRDRQWKYCRTPRVKTFGGTGNGSDCVFPFIYQGSSFSTCIYRTETTGSTRSFVLFCSTTSNLDQNGLWGYCLDYDSCYFPFTYNGMTYSDCISGPNSPRWCSTTNNFDRNKMWTHCPVTCDGYPQQDENSIGFRLLSEQRPCVFKTSISQDTGLILKYYALPTCQLEPLCRNNFAPLFRQITCQEDGRYSQPRAICLPSR